MPVCFPERKNEGKNGYSQSSFGQRGNRGSPIQARVLLRVSVSPSRTEGKALLPKTASTQTSEYGEVELVPP